MVEGGPDWLKGHYSSTYNTKAASAPRMVGAPAVHS